MSERKGSASTVSSLTRVMKDYFPAPGDRIKQYVVEGRRELDWERETCPRVDVPEHDDNTGASCRNVGRTQWTFLNHDCCYTCGDLYETTESRPDVATWLKLKAARPPITSDREALSDEISPDLAVMANPVVAAMTRRKL